MAQIKQRRYFATKNLQSRVLVTLLFAFTLSIVTNGQDDEGCAAEISKSAEKLYKKGTDRKKYSKGERMQFLREAVEIEPDYAAPYYLLGYEMIRTAKYEGSSYKPAEKYFLQLVEVCPDYHSDPFYYLGSIYLGRKDYEKAYKYYKEFLNFQFDDDKKYARDYDKKYEEAKRDFGYVKFFKEQFESPVPFDPVKVKEVSTADEEYLPLITPDNRYMYFTRKIEKKSAVHGSFMKSDKIEYVERFSAAKWIKDKSFEKGEPLDDPFNQDDGFNYGGATISLDNRHIYLTVCKPGKMGYTNCDIYVSHFTEEYNEKTGEVDWHWTELENLGPNVNTEDGWEAQPTLTADGKTLYYASAREGSRGIDIYKSEKDSAGEWQLAENIGPPINTKFNDKSPFIHCDSQTLYYASQGHLGMGGYDIFYVRREDKEWQEPVNIGYPINTEGDEHGFVISTDGKSVFFGSDKVADSRTGLDIYSFALYKEAQPEKVLFLKGQVKDEEGMVLNDARIEVKNTKTNEITELSVDSLDGSYAAVVTLKEGEDMIMNIKSKGKVFNSELFTIEDTAQGIFRDKNIKMEEIKVGKPFKLNDIYYATNSAALKDKSRHILNEFILFLNENPDMKVAIHGHTDNQGSDEYNLALSADRAFSVMQYLQEHGISDKRLSFKGFGETKPIASNETAAGRALNRRTEFVILSR